MQIDYISGGFEQLDRIEPLWQELNRHHQTVSAYFSEDFEFNSYEKRKQSLIDSSSELLVEIAIDQSSMADVAYCISALKKNNLGEIESIYTTPQYRGHKIGDNLMQRAMSWLDDHKVKEKAIAVVHGNEDAWRFYHKFGFFPRVTVLRQRNR